MNGRVTENFLEIPEGMGEGYLPHVLENGISGDVAGSSQKALQCESSRFWPGLDGWGSGTITDPISRHQGRRRTVLGDKMRTSTSQGIFLERWQLMTDVLPHLFEVL